MRWVESAALLVLVLFLCASSAAAQGPTARFDATAQVSWARSGEFDATSAAIGGRFAWHPVNMLGVEAELAFYPGDWPNGRAISSSQREALVGVTFGPRLGRLRPFVKLRSGVLHLAEAPAPFPCILIFPPPLNCRLAAGDTLTAVDYGGGVEVAAGRGLLRVDVGDRLVQYPGPVLDLRRNRRDGAFWSHDLRIGLGVGMRF
jgi:hypothetical protein